MGAQFFGKQAHELASFRCRDRAPHPKRRICGLDRAIGIRLECNLTSAIAAPLMGERTTRPPSFKADLSTPSSRLMSWMVVALDVSVAFPAVMARLNWLTRAQNLVLPGQLARVCAAAISERRAFRTASASCAGNPPSQGPAVPLI